MFLLLGTPEWALAVTETLKSYPQWFIPFDNEGIYFTLRRQESQNLEQLALFALTANSNRASILSLCFLDRF